MGQKYSHQIMSRCRQRLGLEPDNTALDEAIEAWDKLKVLDQCLMWEGIIGYTSMIHSIVHELKIQ